MTKIHSVEDALAILRREGRVEVDIGNDTMTMYKYIDFQDRYFLITGHNIGLLTEADAARQLWHVRKAYNAQLKQIEAIASGGEGE